MNFRTLSKERTIHLMILSSMVLALGVTSFYFDNEVGNPVISVISQILLSPLYMMEELAGLFSSFHILGNPFLMFLFLWAVYLFPALRLHPLLMIRDHKTSDLKAWYNSRLTK